jgi:hypothetical protein
LDDYRIVLYRVINQTCESYITYFLHLSDFFITGKRAWKIKIFLGEVPPIMREIQRQFFLLNNILTRGSLTRCSLKEFLKTVKSKLKVVLHSSVQFTRKRGYNFFRISVKFQEVSKERSFHSS